MMDRVAVILLNHDSSSDCLRCISSLKRQIQVDLEIVIVDNLSSSQDINNLRKVAGDNGCVLIENQNNGGYNAGNNVGLKYASDSGFLFALIANPDMEFSQPDYIFSLVEIMKKDHDYVCVGSDIVTPSGLHENPMVMDDNWRASFVWLRNLVKGNKKDGHSFPDWQYSCECKKISGCCFLVRTNFTKELGYFDEYPFLYCEEAILSRQIEAAGKKIYYCSSVQAIHNHKSSDCLKSSFFFYHWRRSRIYFIKNYSGYSAFGKRMSIIAITLQTFLLLFHTKYLKFKCK